MPIISFLIALQYGRFFVGKEKPPPVRMSRAGETEYLNGSNCEQLILTRASCQEICFAQ